MRNLISVFLISLFAAASGANAEEPMKPQVVLLHGLARSVDGRESNAVTAAGFEVCNVSYPSRRRTIAEFAENFVAPRILGACCA